ncbi:MAG TPA: cysteine--tRNA ligase [Roseiflexaceae bacterium]|nr:cysteine--tRNA ligase [Roseiflexaceae bacterium]
MQLFDTLRGHTAELEIPRDRPLTLYVCGVTPYDTTHVGHAHTFLIFDVLIRYIRSQGGQVRYCQNVTDVDDPLFERAKRDGVDWRELAEREVAQFTQDCRALNLIPPDFFPRASEEIGAMIPIIERLVALGHAYVRNGNVYFDVSTEPSYGEMARVGGYDELLALANERGNNPEDPNKDDPLDFVLWQTGNPGDPTWPSPWGPGRPGWHIECTAMSTRYLGPQLDIHGGGRDLIFPHHPSEIVQTEPVTGRRPFVRFWVHGGLAWLGGEKMSKSLGNMVFVKDALRQHPADALRWYLLSFPYREDFEYVRADVTATEAKVARLQAALAARGGGGWALDAAEAHGGFFAALDNDLDTPRALAQIEGLSAAILEAAGSGGDVASAQAALREMAGVLGFWAAEQGA